MVWEGHPGIDGDEDRKHNQGNQCEANTMLLKGFHSGLAFEWLSYLVSFCMEEGE